MKVETTLSDPLTIIQGDALTELAKLPACSVQCVVTSPPYWGLRDYGTATWEGGDAECDHRHPAEQRQLPHGDGRAKDNYAETRTMTKPGVGAVYKESCRKCGARRIDLQLGLEPTPEAYVANMVAVFREVRRVLREDGTCWLNLGDSYNAYNGNAGPGSGFSRGAACDTERPKLKTGHGLKTNNLKPKDLVGIPWRVAFALQADGWWLRQDIIWSKPNPMPESVKDRCTKAHEYLFLLTKRERYFYDAKAIKEPATTSTVTRLSQSNLGMQVGSVRVPGKTNGNMKAVGTKESANKRSVWTIPTQALSEAHFATFPEALVTPCILAGSRPGDAVLDPFGGSGTVGKVALNLGRRAVLVELNADYVEMAQRRCQTEIGMAI